MSTQTDFVATTEEELHAMEIARYSRYFHHVRQAMDCNEQLNEPASTRLVLLTLAACNHANRAAASLIARRSNVPEITVIRALRRLVELGLVTRHVQSFSDSSLVSYELVMPPAEPSFQSLLDMQVP
jgi:Fic family protein